MRKVKAAAVGPTHAWWPAQPGQPCRAGEPEARHLNAEADVATVWFHGQASTHLREPAVPHQRSMQTPGMLPARTVVAGRYRLEQTLGEGAFAVVYSAWDGLLLRRVAVKVYSVPALYTGTTICVTICADEATLQAACQHPNIMPLYDAGSDPLLAVSFLVMPLYPGADLKAALSRFGPLPFKTALLCADQICSAQEYLWNRRQIVHGDIKPSNVWLTGSGAALLMDFNLPGLLVRGATHGGTPGYTAPEAIESCGGPSSDVFSIGCVLYECLAGEPAFAGDQAVMVGRYTPLRKLRPDLRPELEAVIHAALEADPLQRYQSAREFQTALRHPQSLAPKPCWAIPVLWAAGGGAGACLNIALRLMVYLYRAGWRLLRRAVRHTLHRPLQACVEGLVGLILTEILFQCARRWVAAHQQRVLTIAGGATLAMLLAATVNSYRNQCYFRNRRSENIRGSRC